MKYTAENLLFRPVVNPEDPDQILRITPEQAGWEYITFEARRLAGGDRWSISTGENEMAIICLTGCYAINSTRGSWPKVGERQDVFAGAAHALYLPRRTDVEVIAQEAGEFAVACAPTHEDHEPWWIRPEDVSVSIRGGDHATRQINSLLPPGSPVHRLVLVEVYTPGGNWSSYPGHKHDAHVEDEDGNLIEADLEEVYFFKFDRPEGYALQRVYTEARSPMHQAGNPIDAVCVPEENCAVIVPEGHHPVSSPPGYTTYYLNVLAGSAQSLANQEDPRYAWVGRTYKTVDSRLPLY
jgi:5-deoxy-glucuronate isomerase